jgi:putative peptidoglycan lipid II flippase
MKGRIISRATKRLSVGGAAALLVATSLIGQVLGFLRVKFVNANFDALGPESTDAFFAAFKIPDFFFYTVAAGALGVAFIPVLADHLERHDRKGVWDLSTSLLNLLAIVMAFVGVIIFVFAEPLIRLVAPGLEADPSQFQNAVTIMRLVAFNPLLFAVAGIMTATQQTFGRFFFYAIGPLLYNISIILSIFVFKDSLGLVGLGVGALVGAILQVVIVFFGNGGLNFTWRPRINFASADFRKILRQLPPRSVDQGLDSINSVVETNFASRLGTSYLSFYESAFVLHTAPILLIGSAISTAAFPRMSERLAQGRVDLFRREFLQILRIMIWISVPVVVFCFFARGYLARIIFAKDAPEIAAIFGFLCAAIFFRVIYAIVSRYFYAQKDTWTPLIVSIFAIALNIVLAWNLSRPWNYGVSGLAMAQSIVAATEVSILFGIMLVKDRRLFDRQFLGGVWRIMSVTGFSVVATYIMVNVFPLQSTDTGFLTLGFKLFLIASATAVVHLAMSSLFSLEEAVPVVHKLRQLGRLVLRPVKVDW